MSEAPRRLPVERPENKTLDEIVAAVLVCRYGVSRRAPYYAAFSKARQPQQHKH